jgi:hypothetical protein
LKANLSRFAHAWRDRPFAVGAAKSEVLQTESGGTRAGDKPAMRDWLRGAGRAARRSCPQTRQQLRCLRCRY